MNRRDLHFVSTEYEPGVTCACRANAYQWKLCDRHAALESARHREVLREHSERSAQIVADYLT